MKLYDVPPSGRGGRGTADPRRRGLRARVVAAVLLAAICFFMPGWGWLVHLLRSGLTGLISGFLGGLGTRYADHVVDRSAQSVVQSDFEIALAQGNSTSTRYASIRYARRSASA